MRTYTTCESCGGQLQLARPHQASHERCDDEPNVLRDLDRDLHIAAHRGDDAEVDRIIAAIDDYDLRPPQLYAAALVYASWGWPVFPCVPGHKRPATQHGLHDATTDPARIAEWWARLPTANIGLATGHHFDVLDVDPHGLLWWNDLRNTPRPDLPDLDIHGETSTPRGGLHAYLAPSGGGNLAGFAPGVDYRGLGGYVLAPPSVLHPEALDHPPSWPLRYRWWVKPSPTIKEGS